MKQETVCNHGKSQPKYRQKVLNNATKNANNSQMNKNWLKHRKKKIVNENGKFPDDQFDFKLL